MSKAKNTTNLERDRLYEVRDLCAALGVGRRVLYGWIQAGQLRYLRTGSPARYRFRGADVKEDLERMTRRDKPNA